MKTVYEIIKSFNETTKLAIRDGKVYVLKVIPFEDTELYRRLSGISSEYVAKVYETVRIENEFYAVIEFIQGVTLTDYIKKNGVMTDVQLRDIILQLCSGLEAIHSLGIIHRDINPNNIMLDDSGKVKIIDFGISRFQKANQAADTQILGTQGFAAPEQFGFSQTSIRSDIYSVGVLINYLKTGCLPSEKTDNGEFSSVILKCTQMDEHNRYSNTAELASDIAHGKKFDRFIRSIPGFRKNVLWHKVVALIYYAFDALLIFGPTYEGEYDFKNDILWDAGVFFMFVVPVPILLNQFDWQNRWSFTRNKIKSSKNLVSVLLTIVSLLISSVFILMTNK